MKFIMFDWYLVLGSCSAHDNVEIWTYKLHEISFMFLIVCTIVFLHEKDTLIYWKIYINKGLLNLMKGTNSDRRKSRLRNESNNFYFSHKRKQCISPISIVSFHVKKLMKFTKIHFTNY